MESWRSVAPSVLWVGLGAIAVASLAGCANAQGAVNPVSVSPTAIAAPAPTATMPVSQEKPSSYDSADQASPWPPATSGVTWATPSPTTGDEPGMRPEPQWPVAPGALVLGDSISLSIAPALTRLGYPVTGKVGQSASLPYLLEHLSTPAAASAPAWVIVLGTNNRGDETDIAELVPMAEAINEVRKAHQDVYWVTPHRPEAYSGGMSTHDLDEFGAELARMDRHRTWLRVLDFNGLALKHPEWFANDGQHLHPDEDGQAALVNLIAGPAPVEAAAAAPINDLTPTQTPSREPADENVQQDYSEIEFENSP